MANNFTDSLKEMGVDNQTLSTFAQILDIPDSIFEANKEEFLKNIESGVDETTIDVLKRNCMLKGLTKEQFVEETLAADDTFLKLIEEGKFSSAKKEVMVATFAKLEKLLKESLFRQKIQVKFEKINPEVKLPTYAHPTDACADIYAAEEVSIKAGEVVLISTGFKMAVPEGYEVVIRPRSGLSIKSTLIIPNSPGTIDSGYRDEVKVPMRNVGKNTVKIEKGDRIAQMTIKLSPMMDIVEVPSVAAVGEDRKGGFGSTGK